VFDDGENIIGLILLGLCAVVGGVLVWQIVTGERLRYDGPAWLAWLLLILFVGGSLFGLARGGLGRRGMGPRWPDPRTGHRPWWRRFFRGDDDGQGTP
jgi:hypothetical protein